MTRALTCRKAHQLIDEAFDDGLDEATRLDLDGHLSACPACRRFCESAGTVREVLEAQPDVLPSDEKVRQMRANFEWKLEQEPLPRPHGRRAGLWAVGLAAAVACLCIAGWLAVSFISGDSSPSTPTASSSHSPPSPPSPPASQEMIDGSSATRPELAPSIASVEAISQGVTINREDQAIDVAQTMQLNEGDRVTTGEGGRGALSLNEGVRVALGRSTSMELQQLTIEELTVYLTEGWIVCSVAPDQGHHLEVRTTTTSIRVVGTVFAVEASSEGVAQVRVIEGRVEVITREGQTTRLEAGQTIQFPEGGQQPLSRHATARDQALLLGDLIPSAPSQDAHGTPTKVDLGELFRQAEASRRQGDCARATSLYKRIVSSNPSGASAGTALISLGQHCLGGCRCAGEARRAYRAYISGHRGGSMRQEAFVGLMRAERALGHLDAARTVARRYLNEHPNGRYTSMAEGLLDDSP